MSTRIAVVTGATRGIGRGLFQRLAAAGCVVASTYHRDEEAAEGFRVLAKQAGIDSVLSKVDVADLPSLQAFIQNVMERFGRVDYLINNVGVDDFQQVYDLTLEDWRRSQDVILNAPFVLMKAVLPRMRLQRFGRIVNIGASSNNYFGGVRNAAAFGVHKAALAVLTRTVALEELGHGITVNMVSPGSTAGAGILPEEERIPISRIPLGRRVSVEEVVHAIMYFLSDSATGVTGQVLAINGGLST